MENITSEKFASTIARFLDDNKAKDIVILNVANVSSLSDFFIVQATPANVIPPPIKEEYTVTNVSK